MMDAEKTGLGNPTVLCLTENRAFLNRVRSSLGAAGFSVVICRTEDDAREMISMSRFDVLILDQSLSSTDGLTIWGDIRRTLLHDGPPALIAVERLDAALLSQVVAAGAAGTILTSVRGEEIVEHVLGVMTNPARRAIVEETLGERVLDGGMDPVTRIANNHHFSRRMVGESVAAYRDGLHLTVLMVSIDQFSILFNKHGRERTDDLLAQVARVIEGDLRSRDCAARYSDHAFCVILSEADLGAATAVGRRLAQAIESTEFSDLDHPIAVTVSVGVACRPAGTQASPDEIIGHALKGCVAAEQMGGNRVVADRSLTGRPLALVFCVDPGLREEIAGCLSGHHIEVRGAGTVEEARRMLAEVPVSLLAAISARAAGEGSEGVELLAWARGRFPATRRVLAAPALDMPAVLEAVNLAGIHRLLAVPWSDECVDELVEKLIYS